MGTATRIRRLRLALRVVCAGVAVAPVLMAILAAAFGRHPTGVSDTLLSALKQYSLAHKSYPYDQRGASYALYALKDDYTWVAQSLHDRRGFTMPRRDFGLLQSTGTREPSTAQVWDDSAGKFVYPGVDYLNWDPDRVRLAPESVVLLSFDTSKWRKTVPVRFCATEEVAPEYPYWRGKYQSWVRPRHLIGLPSAPIYELSEYGVKWGLSGAL